MNHRLSWSLQIPDVQHKYLMYNHIVLPIFLQYLMNAEYLISILITSEFMLMISWQKSEPLHQPVLIHCKKTAYTA
jgi:hypothetical protein